jgi:hypothetical protein
MGIKSAVHTMEPSLIRTTSLLRQGGGGGYYGHHYHLARLGALHAPAEGLLLPGHEVMVVKVHTIIHNYTSVGGHQRNFMPSFSPSMNIIQAPSY